MMKTLIKPRLPVIISIAILTMLLVVVAHPGDVLRYDTQIMSDSQVYDGDTIMDCKVFLTDIVGESNQTIWPGLQIEKGKLYLITDLRIAGIDTPEKRVSRKKRDGSLRSERSRANERFASEQSRQALIDLLALNDYRFEIVDPKRGKYAGRTIGRCVIDGVDAGKYLIKHGHAIPNEGGTKTELDWEMLDAGLVR